MPEKRTKSIFQFKLFFSVMEKENPTLALQAVLKHVVFFLHPP